MQWPAEGTQVPRKPRGVRGAQDVGPTLFSASCCRTWSSTACQICSTSGKQGKRRHAWSQQLPGLQSLLAQAVTGVGGQHPAQPPETCGQPWLQSPGRGWRQSTGLLVSPGEAWS